MKKKKRCLLFWLMLSVLMGGTGTISAMTAMGLTGRFVTDKVDIRVEGYQLEQGSEVWWQETGMLLPGDRLSQIPRIYNDGSACYVRARITLRAEGVEGCDLAALCMDGMDDSWIKAEDGYYYKVNSIPPGGSADLFQRILLPEDLPQEEWENKAVCLDICVDAIQSSHFTPDFTAKMPWGEVEILQYIEKDPFEISYCKPVEDTAAGDTIPKDTSSVNTGDQTGWSSWLGAMGLSLLLGRCAAVRLGKGGGRDE